jgi:mRNA interferase YafQ
MSLQIKVHKQFVKDLRKAKLNQTNLEKLFLYISLLSKGETLSPEAKDHQLKGEWNDIREFHVSGDLLVLYRREKNEIHFLRIGTHSQIFG